MSRLEEIKEHYQLWRFNEKNRALPSSTGIDYEDLIYLVNRVEELEEAVKAYKEAKDWLKEVQDNVDQMESVLEENERYKQALEQARHQITKPYPIKGTNTLFALQVIDQALNQSK